MSITCCVPVIESVYCLACLRWVWKKCMYAAAGRESEHWGLATFEEFDPVPRLCRVMLSEYEDDLLNPLWEPPCGYGMDPNWVVLRKDHEQTQGRAPPYMIYLDHDHRDVVLAVRGLNLGRESDYAVLLDNKLGQTKLDGGYVHNGLLKAAEWIFDVECEVLGDLLEKHPEYTVTFIGHSLGAGIVALLTIVAVQNREKLGNVERKRIRCYAMAPARCTSLNLAVRYADIINSVVLQDDFLPRATVALEEFFKSVFCLPCLLCYMCLKDTFTLEEQMFRDPRRLYAPGRLYHIVERKPLRIFIDQDAGQLLMASTVFCYICCRLGTFPPVVRTAVPVDGRFEHIALSCRAITDHSIICIERESQKALELMLEEDRALNIPAKQKMERQRSVVREHDEEYQAALKRAIDLDIPLAYSPTPTYGTFNDTEGENSGKSTEERPSFSSTRKESWEGFVKRLFRVDSSGQIVFKNPSSPN